MKWQDTGILTAITKFGDTDVIATFITENHGLATGLIKGGISKKQSPFLQIGNTFNLIWKSRLEEQLGFFTFDPITILGMKLYDNIQKLKLLSCCLNLIYDGLSQNTPNPIIYKSTTSLIENITNINDEKQLLLTYINWELNFLKNIGFGFSLQKCNATGTTENLCYISPKTGHAICAVAGEPYKSRLLPLPKIFKNEICFDNICFDDIEEGLNTLAFFLEKHIYSEKNKSLPYIRKKLI